MSELTTTASLFSAVEMAPRDPILGLTEAFIADARPHKVNLGVGVYYDDNGKVPLLAAVRAAEEARTNAALPRSYQPIEGPAAYNRAVQTLLFGDASAIVTEARAVTVQAPGGTGALRIGADFLKQLLPEAKVYISDPSWENHRGLFEAAGFEVETYPYYDPTTRGVAFAAMKSKLATLPERSIIVLHACCHNPTGADLSEIQWREIVDIVSKRGLVAFVDIAYQGFAEGIERDAAAVELFANAGLSFLVASSFSKSFSLYGERVGALTAVAQSKDEAARVLSQAKRVVRTNYSNPPTHGGAVVAAVLADAKLRNRWEEELASMRDRIRSMRSKLVERLQAQGANDDFSFFLHQRGMFSYTGLTADQVERLRSDFGIYAVSTGRICVAALNSHNIDFVAEAIASVLKK